MDSIYSKKILTFIQYLKEAIVGILRREVGCRVENGRFSLMGGRGSYLIKIAIFEHPKRVGYFDSEYCEIGIHKKFISAREGEPQKRLYNLLRHELAHYLAFILYGHCEAHGWAFKSVCARYGWGEEVSSAVEVLQEPSVIQSIEVEDRVLEKVQKLLALASSANPHEAELAALKSHELLLKHNMTMAQSLSKEDEEEYAVKRLYKLSKKNAKVNAISQILKFFFVTSIYCAYDELVCLEIFGTRSNVAIAEYVGIFLEREFDRLWDQARSANPNLKGLASKNSFFRGLAQGYCEKMESHRRSFSSSESQALALVEDNLEKKISWAFPHLRRNSSRYARHCEESSRLGLAAGQKLNISTAVKNESSGSATLLLG